MATFADLISNVRIMIPDSNSTRWSDSDLLVVIGKAVTLINYELYQQGITFARSSATFTSADGTYQYSLSSDLSVTDYMMWDMLWDTDNEDRIAYITDAMWESITSCGTADYFRINGSNLELKDTPTEAINYRFYYWPTIDTSGYATTTSAPWSDRCNEIIEEYVISRCKHRDEMLTNADGIFSYNVAKAVYRTFGHYGGSEPYVEGWL